MTSLAIDGLELVPLRFALARVAANAKHRWTERQGVRVVVHARGLRGDGEASPLPGFSPDTLDDARRELEAVRDALVGARLSLEGDPLAALDETLRGTTWRSPAALFAIETALLDLRARARGVPLWRDLGGSPELGALRLSALLAGDTEEELVASAEAALARGLATAKLKVGRPNALATEARFVASILRATGPSLRLRLDANGAWTLAEAALAFDLLGPLGPELLEEPVSGSAWLSLPKTNLPLAMDESLGTPDGDALLHQLLARHLNIGVVVKPSIAGGFRRAIRTCETAIVANRPVIWTHMFEGPIATAAAAAIALACPRRDHAAGLDVRSYLELPDNHPIGPREVSGVDAPGLGLRQPEDAS